MTRENSSCKFGALLAGCCRRQAALFTLSVLSMLAAMPIAMILSIRYQLRFHWNNDDPELRVYLVESIRNTLCSGTAASVVLILLAIIAGIAGFRYLNVHSQTDFYHALPVTRGRLFAVRITTGLLAVVPVYLMGVLLSCGVCAAYGYADAIDAGKLAYSIIAHLAGFLLIYALSVLSAILCGNTLVSLLLCGWFQFGLMGGWAVLHYLLNVFYPARPINEVNIPMWTAPPVQIFKMTASFYSYLWNSDQADYVKICLLPALAYLVTAVVVLALCYALYRIRKSENTGMAMAFPHTQLPVKLYMVTVIGLGCGLLFEVLTTSWSIMFLGIMLGAGISACVIEIIYAMDFHGMLQHWKSMLLYTGVCAIVLGCMAADVTQWNTAIPSRDDIVSADLDSESMPAWNCESYVTQGGTYLDYVSTDIESQQDATGSEQESQLESEGAIDAIYNSASIGAQAMRGDRSSIREGVNGDNYSYTVTFTLKNGETFRRTYYMPVDTDALSKNGAAVRFSEEYLDTRTAVALAKDRKDSFSMMMIGNYTDDGMFSARTQTTRDIQNVLDMLKMESMSLTEDYVSNNAPVLVLRVATEQGQKELAWNGQANLSYGSSNLYDLPVYANETTTLELLSDLFPQVQAGFGTAQIQSITVTTYDEEDNMKETVYTADDEIAGWKDRIVPQVFNTVLDPVYTLSDQDISVALQDGTVIYCQCRAQSGDSTS